MIAKVNAGTLTLTLDSADSIFSFLVAYSDIILACKETTRLKNLDTRLNELSGFINLLGTIGWAFAEEMWISPGGGDALYTAIMNT